jgi:hypothetical protein
MMPTSPNSESDVNMQKKYINCTFNDGEVEAINRLYLLIHSTPNENRDSIRLGHNIEDIYELLESSYYELQYKIN